MTTSAIVMMIVAALIIWGGLAVSTWFLVTHPLDNAPHPHDTHDFDRWPADPPADA